MLVSSARNLTGSNGRLRKDKRQTCRKLGSGGLGAWTETTQQLDTTVSLLYTMVNKEIEQQFCGGGRDIVVLGNGGTCNRYPLDVNILGKAAVLHFALTPFCSCGLCQSQPADMAVLMSSSHRLLTLCFPQPPVTEVQ
jgi:hypothetical protein